MMLVFQLRMLELVLPDDWLFPNKVANEDKIGESWWPDTWNVPSCFQHVLYLVAPPQKLAQGQYDLVRELKEGGLTWPKTTSVGRPMGDKEEQEQADYLNKLF